MEVLSASDKIPKEGMAGLKENWKSDILAGFLVFLISLPLALGVAMACGLPPFAGILTSIIGGIFIVHFQGSFLAIKSPAAGLIIIVSQCVQELGKGDILDGYKLTLAVIVVSGVIQMLFGIVRIGVLGDFFPSSAVFGMLASIGIILTTRQIHILFGAEIKFDTMYEAIVRIPESLFHFNPEIFIIGFTCLLILYLLPLIKNKYIKMIPAPMLAIIVAIPLGHLFDLEHQHKYLFLDGSQYEIGPSFLVSLPSVFMDGFTFPDFDQVLTLTSFKYVLMFALVGTLESLVSTKAIDNLDQYRRRSDLNKDLFSIGLGNTICGFLGGLPMISEIVRSSSNVFNGAKTKWSSFFNGLFILVFAIIAPGFIHQIPLSALAALLIYVGLRLASPIIFYEIYKVGFMQFVIFLTTIVVTLSTNILIGMFAGILVNFIIQMIAGVPFHSLFKSRIVVQKNDKERVYMMLVYDAAIFTNYLSFKSQLDKIPVGYDIIIDFSNVKVIDHTVMEHMHYYGEDYLKQGRTIHIKGMESLKSWSNHPLSFRVASSNLNNSLLGNVRENELKEFAKSIGFKFKNSIPVSSSQFGKIFGENIRIKYEGNISLGKVNGLTFKVSDLSLVGVGDFKAQIYQVTALTISGILPLLPSFSLTKEGLMDKIMDKTFINDIDFDEHPAFSSRYLLKASNEGETREFFTTTLIEFLEREELYNIESYGNEMIIYKTRSMLNSGQIIQLLDFGKKLIEKITVRNLEEK